jgi:arginase
VSRRFILTPFFIDHFEQGLLPLAGACWDVNLPALPPGSPQGRVASLLRPLSDLVAETASQGGIPVSISGDCLSAIGVAAGLQRAGIDPAVVWLDAHGDFNTWETTISGFLGGMPMAMLVGRGEQTIAQAVDLRPIEETRVVLADGRDLDHEEATALADSDITRVNRVEDLPEVLPGGPLHVHFDTDLVDPTEARAMNYPAPGGPSGQALKAVFRHLAETNRIVAVSMSSWNPDLDSDGTSRQVCMDLLGVLSGELKEN